MTDTTGNGTAVAKVKAQQELGRKALALTDVPRERIEQAIAELKFIIPGAANMAVPALWVLAQTGLAYDLDPAAREIFLIVANEKPLGVMVGIAGWRRKAQEQSPFMTDFQELDQAEKRDIQYKEGDVARKCLLWRVDIVKVMGAKSVPFVGYGVVRAGENFGNRDMWNRLSRAKKRAEMDAIKQAFSLRMPKEPRHRPDVQIIGVGEPEDEGETAAIATISETDGEWSAAEVVEDTPADEPQAQPETPQQQAQAAGISVPHWTSDQSKLNKFWASCKEMDVTPKEAHEKLGVNSIKDTPLTFDQAMVEIRAYANEKADRRSAAEEQGPLLKQAKVAG